MASVLVPLANGFEEIEAITTIDILRRGECRVVTAALGEDLQVTGNHEITVLADTLLSDVCDREFDLIALPGGMPGASHLRADERLAGMLKAQAERGSWLAAICAAPMVLAAAGLLDGLRCTSFPGFLNEFPALIQTAALVEMDGRVVTARGPGAAMDYALALVSCLKGAESAEVVASRLQR